MAKRSTKFYRKNEREIMERLGLKPTKNSGAGWVEKEDGQNDFILAQLKSTDAKSIKIQLEDIHKLEYNAIVAHKIPVFVIQFLSTGEIFIMSKPADLPSVVKYLECGKCDIIQNEVIEEIISSEEHKIKPKIKSGNREKFWQEKEKEWKQKNAKKN